MSVAPEAEPAARILVVEDDAMVRRALAEWLGIAGFQVEVAEEAHGALSRLESGAFDLVLSDVRMPGLSGLDLLERIRARDADLPVILVTGHGDVPLAVEAMRAGAHDFITKPYDPDHLAAILRRALRMRNASTEISHLRARIAAQDDVIGARLLGPSAPMEALRRAARQVARSPADIILYGETGTGKEVLAQAIHAASARAAGPFIAINCAAIPADLAESELFGHEEGAFTSARTARAGKFEAASGGTLFLDEIESLPLAIQAKLLRVLQERQAERLGGNRIYTVQCRVIAAAKENLRMAGEAGRFRPDLYYRLAGAELSLPPLRERPGDAPVLFALFARQAAEKEGLPVRPIRPSDMDALLAHAWPGNVRELKALAERFAYGLLPAEGGLGAALAPESRPASGADLETRLQAFEQRIIEATLAGCQGSVTRAAAELGLPRRTLADRMARLGIRARN